MTWPQCKKESLATADLVKTLSERAPINLKAPETASQRLLTAACMTTFLQVPAVVILLSPQTTCQSFPLFPNGLELGSVQSSEKKVTVPRAVVFQWK